MTKCQLVIRYGGAPRMEPLRWDAEVDDDRRVLVNGKHFATLDEEQVVREGDILECVLSE